MFTAVIKSKRKKLSRQLARHREQTIDNVTYVLDLESQQPSLPQNASIAKLARPARTVRVRATVDLSSSFYD